MSLSEYVHSASPLQVFSSARCGIRRRYIGANLSRIEHRMVPLPQKGSDGVLGIFRSGAANVLWENWGLTRPSR